MTNYDGITKCVKFLLPIATGLDSDTVQGQKFRKGLIIFC